MKVLNLYSGIGGNRKYWENVEELIGLSDINIDESFCYLFPELKYLEVIGCFVEQFPVLS